MGTIKEIKKRKQSIESINHITKAMKLVAVSKLQKSKEKVMNYKEYMDKFYEVVDGNEIKEGLFINNNEGIGLLIISSDKGLAGGFNSNLIKELKNKGELNQCSAIFVRGKKANDELLRMGIDVTKTYEYVEKIDLFDVANNIAGELFEIYKKGTVEKLYIAFTKFENMIRQIPECIQVLPNKPNNLLQENEWDESAVKEKLEFYYLRSMIYGTLLESDVSEHAARMQAMDKAVKNAEELIETFTVQYNRARQGAITQELTEILSGAKALE